MKASMASALALLGKIAQSDVIRYVFEILVVFLGVYLAFLFTDFQDNARERAIRVQHYQSLSLELSILASTLEIEEQKLLVHMKVVDEIDQGTRPPIPPSDLLFYYHGSVRDAAFNSRHFEALDSEVVQNIMSCSRNMGINNPIFTIESSRGEHYEQANCNERNAIN